MATTKLGCVTLMTWSSIPCWASAYLTPCIRSFSGMRTDIEIKAALSGLGPAQL
jgi:hypothetical protein